MGAGTKVAVIEEQNFDKITSQGTVLVDFYADWCGPCKMLAPVLDQVAAEIEEGVSIVKINVDNAQNVSSRFGITSIPTLLLFKNGKMVGQMKGLRRKEEVISFIQGQK